ncbi:UNVERIFIED_CONTAM: Heavy metal-associated isoprenylated plant protein 44 [Sesamum radiatum]|uniref:Heavy metal-associated isoprenylated plant protein 44 n=1 Tax=Sesamum radiatum TaxID=300843 RepID=A0AAW2Q2S9_SESRA
MNCSRSNNSTIIRIKLLKTESKNVIKRDSARKAELDSSNPIICFWANGATSEARAFEPWIPDFDITTTELKVEMVGIHEKRLRKCLSKLKGIEKVEVDGNSQKVMVTGYAHRNKILKAVRRAGLKADFWSAQNELLNVYASSSFQNLRFNNFNFF